MDNNQPVKKKSRLKKILGGIFLFFLLITIVSTLSDSNTAVVSETSSQVFDTPALLGKNLPELVSALGTPSENSEPTNANIQAGTKTWEKSWKRGDYFLMATYDIATKNVVDLFVGADTDTGFSAFKDTNNILAVGNLSRSDSRYSVEFVKAVNASGYTGAIVKQK